jgi:hypothetical protein
MQLITYTYLYSKPAITQQTTYHFDNHYDYHFDRYSLKVKRSPHLSAQKVLAVGASGEFFTSVFVHSEETISSQCTCYRFSHLLYQHSI